MTQQSTPGVSTGSTAGSQSAVRYDRGDDGIVVLTLDDPTSSANTMNDLYKESMAEAVERLESEKDDITGVVVTSAKKTFFAGGNLNKMMQAGPDDAADVFATAEEIKAQLRRLETLGKPVAAAINGTASAAVSRSHSPVITGSLSATRGSSSACPRSLSACCPVAAVSRARFGCSACRPR